MISLISSYLPSMQSLPEISVSSKKVFTITALAVTTFGLASLQTTEAGPITYGSCVLGCEALATAATGGPGAAFITQCIQGCLPLLAPWCP